MSEKKTYYSTIKVFNCIGGKNDDKRYHGVGAVLCLSNIRSKTVGDKAVVEARCAINNRTKTINGALKTSFTSDVLWADVVFWEEKATRFKKFLGDRQKILLGIFGTIKADQYKKTDGTDGESITISVDEWFNVGGGKTDATENMDYDSSYESAFIPSEYIPTEDEPF